MAPPTLLVHGFMSSNHQWEPNLPRLGATLRTVLVEQRGHGASATPDDVDEYRPESVIAELESIRERLGIDRWWVIGHSMGGAVCVRYALEHPDRTLGLVFTNSRAVFGIEGASDEQRAAERRSVLVEDGDDLRQLPFHPIHAKRFPEDLKAKMVAAADAMQASAIRNLGSVATSWNARDRLNELGVPVLLVNGRFGEGVPAVDSRSRARRSPISGLVELDGGHSIKHRERRRLRSGGARLRRRSRRGLSAVSAPTTRAPTSRAVVALGATSPRWAARW